MSNENISKLLDIMSQLRDPETGCPWDIKQNFDTIAPYTVEEAYEVADAIERKDMNDLKDELGDLLLQVVFHAQMAKEAGLFDFNDVVDSISDKMVNRHPHIFGDVDAADADEVIAIWEATKAKERKAKREKAGLTDEEALPSVLDGITNALPSLTKAYKMQKRCKDIGFEWETIDGVYDKINEEMDELKVEINANENGSHKDKIFEEYGDLMFVLTDLARWQGFDPEQSLQAACRKFDRRFRGVEAKLHAQGKTHIDTDLEEVDALWNEVKAEEKKAKQA